MKHPSYQVNYTLKRKKKKHERGEGEHLNGEAKRNRLGLNEETKVVGLETDLTARST